MQKPEPCVKFQNASDELEDSTEMVRDALDGDTVLDRRDKIIMDKLYERCMNFTYYYEKFYDREGE